MAKTTLIAVATPGDYHRFAQDLMISALDHFHPTFELQPLILPGVVGEWPTSTITRPRVMLNNWDKVEGDYVFAIDADMLIVDHCGEELLGELVATEHPGYVGHHCTTVPYDRNPRSATCIGMGGGWRYYAGGFYGGERNAVLDLLFAMEAMLDTDAANGIIPRWHDESSLNAALAQSPPTVVLSPSYCYPDDDSYYRRDVWQQDYKRRIVALDKTPVQRGNR